MDTDQKCWDTDSELSLQPPITKSIPNATTHCYNMIYSVEENLYFKKLPCNFDAQPDLETTVLNNILNLLMNMF